MIILCTVDITTREVTIPSDQRIASYDHNVDVIRFQVETIPGFSLDTSSIKIAAQGPNQVRHDYAVDPSTVSIEEETGYITFDWPIPAGVTEMPIGTFKYGDKGQLIFAVCAEIISGNTMTKAWHSDDGIITVVAHLEPESGGGEDPAEEATNAQKIAQLQADVAVINTQVGALGNGSPAPVSTVAEMTDESAVYLYTGSETGYTAGNWYFWNGSAWTSGGTYGGAVTSTTFNQHGVPADDFATGQALALKASASDVTALTTAVAGKADSADVTAIDARVTSVEGAITDFQLIMTTGQYVNYDNGILSSNLWAISNNFPLAKGLAVKVTTNIYNTAAIGFFDSDDNYLGGIKSSEGGAVREYNIENFPAKTAYMRVSCLNSDKDAVRIDVIDLYGKISDFFHATNNDYVEIVKSSDIIDGKLVKADGTEATSESWECTDYLPVIPGSAVIVNCVCYGIGATCFFDEDKNVVIGIDGNNVGQYGGASSYRAQVLNITLPANAKFVRFSALKTFARATSLYIQYALPWNKYSFDLITKVSQFESETDKYYTEKKILVFGDSISADAYGNYKKWVTNLIDEGKFNLVNTTNSSQHATGFVARYDNQPNDFISRMEGIANKGDYDLVIVFGGINDYIRSVPLGGESGQTDITTYFKPAVDYFFNYLINNFTQARICVLTPLRTSNTTPNSAGNKQEVYADYIREVAQSYCLPILDLTVDSGFCPFVPAFKNRWTLVPSGYTDPDGVHPIAEYEKKYLAPLIWKFLNGLLLE